METLPQTQPTRQDTFPNFATPGSRPQVFERRHPVDMLPPSRMAPTVSAQAHLSQPMAWVERQPQQASHPMYFDAQPRSCPDGSTVPRPVLPTREMPHAWDTSAPARMHPNTFAGTPDCSPQEWRIPGSGNGFAFPPVGAQPHWTSEGINESAGASIDQLLQETRRLQQTLDNMASRGFVLADRPGEYDSQFPLELRENPRLEAQCVPRREHFPASPSTPSMPHRERKPAYLSVSLTPDLLSLNKSCLPPGESHCNRGPTHRAQPSPLDVFSSSLEDPSVRLGGAFLTPPSCLPEHLRMQGFMTAMLAREACPPDPSWGIPVYGR